MLPATIETAVAPETITKVTRLFNGSAGDIIAELLQNARRAGASRVVVTLIGQPGDRLLTVTDDGSGIADPSAIVTLGRSGWSAEAIDREDPAGMGVFSLAGHDVIVRSWSRPEQQGWCAHIPPTAWATSRPIAIEADPISCGTAISMRMPEAWADKLRTTLEAAALFYPLPVIFDGVELPRRSWLDGARHVEDWNGCRIGVFDDLRSDQPVSSSIRVNFHGLTVKCEMPGVSEVDRGRKWTVRIDIVDAPQIQLVLPARKEVIENAGLDALRIAAQAAIFRAIAGAGSHRLSYETWSKAHDAGVTLPEAEPYLFGWNAPHADYRNNYGSGPRTQNPAMVLVPDLTALVAQPMRVALGAGKGLGGPLVEAQPRFVGYSWYDALARMQDVRFRIERDGSVFEVDEARQAPVDTADGIVDSILLLVTIAENGSSRHVQRHADVAFSPDPFTGDDIDEIGIYIRRGADIASGDLADLLERSAFDPSTDSGDDSYETQLDRFRATALKRAVKLVEGDDAALASQLRTLLQSHAWIVPEDRTVAITVTREAIDIAVTTRVG